VLKSARLFRPVVAIVLSANKSAVATAIPVAPTLLTVNRRSRVSQIIITKIVLQEVRVDLVIFMPGCPHMHRSLKMTRLLCALLVINFCRCSHFNLQTLLAKTLSTRSMEEAKMVYISMGGGYCDRYNLARRLSERLTLRRSDVHSCRHIKKCCSSLWPSCVPNADIISSSCGFFSSPFLFFFFFCFFLSFSSPNLSGRRVDVYHTSTRSVALVQI